MANNKVTIYIHNQRYRFLAEENEDYLQQCADIVNKEMDNAMDGNTLSITDGAVLAAMNVADKYCKERMVSDNLRAQLKQALDDGKRVVDELAAKPTIQFQVIGDDLTQKGDAVDDAAGGYQAGLGN